ncbi:MAG: hypothetical protein JW846_04890 [Dehalococcoidia bacterium]|nr:hypothetical protein [Dehalococcoidia bacterium]
MENQKLVRTELLSLLSDLDAATIAWDTVYLRSDSLAARASASSLHPEKDKRLLHIDTFTQEEHVTRELARYGTGLVAFHSESAAFAIVPPFPVSEDILTSGRPMTQPLRTMLEYPHRILLVLVTWGAYVAALYEGPTYQRHKKGTGHIHPPHRKGGSSSARFARRTEEQRKEFLKRAGSNIDEVFGEEPVDYLFFGGNRLILKPLEAYSGVIRKAGARLSPRTLNVKKATLDVISDALKDATTSVLFHP